MQGTLCKGDIVNVDCISFESILTGDIIVYAEQAHDDLKTIHRVVSISPKELITQGDNCPNPDSHPVTKQHLIGKVSTVDRKGKPRQIAGGATGLRHATKLRTIKQFKTLLYPILHPPYLFIGKIIVKHLNWQPKIHQIQIKSSSGTITKQIHNNKTIAHWNPRTKEWCCKKPYDLILKKPK